MFPPAGHYAVHRALGSRLRAPGGDVVRWALGEHGFFVGAATVLAQRTRSSWAPHPFTHSAPVTTGAEGGKGCAQDKPTPNHMSPTQPLSFPNSARVLRGGAPVSAQRTPTSAPSLPFTHSAPITTGAEGGKGCAQDKATPNHMSPTQPLPFPH
ncbi:hypothetical protein OSR35_21570, partial [Paenarthrobacter ureafaciens]|uniref:hypothetical protein n=1 Tax=Paenarthrobacter ureafaciens TaxID=37931 RepID=UPI002263FBF0